MCPQPHAWFPGGCLYFLPKHRLQSSQGATYSATPNIGLPPNSYLAFYSLHEAYKISLKSAGAVEKNASKTRPSPLPTPPPSVPTDTPSSPSPHHPRPNVTHTFESQLSHNVLPDRLNTAAHLNNTFMHVRLVVLWSLLLFFSVLSCSFLHYFLPEGSPPPSLQKIMAILLLGAASEAIFTAALVLRYVPIPTFVIRADTNLV